MGLLWQWKDQIERHLHPRSRDLFDDGLDLVFFNTTSTYFEGIALDGWAKRGKSRDHRPDHLQLMLGIVMRRDGTPVTCEIWPGNTADSQTVIPILESLRKRFHIRRVVLVCDRGMSDAANLRAIDAAGYGYIVGMKMRRQFEVREEVLRRAGRFREVKHNLHVKEVWVDDRRYVVCFNPEPAEQDRRDRDAIVEKLRRKLAHGGVGDLVQNRDFRRFLKVEPGSAKLDEEKIKADAKFDGIYVLRTTTALDAAEVAEAYRQLTWIERLWREMKDVVEVRPIYHHLKKNNVRGHIFVSFLALFLCASLRRRLDDLHRAETPAKDPTPQAKEPARLHVPWDDLIRDLSKLRAMRVKLDVDRYLLRTELSGAANDAFRAVGVHPPPLAQPLAR